VTADHAVLRTSLLPSLVAATEHNLNVGNEDPALFEVARVYLPSAEGLPEERLHVGGVTTGGYARAKGAVDVLFSALKLEARFARGTHELMHPGKTAETTGGWVGELHPEVLDGRFGAFELDLETLLEQAPGPPVYEDVITYPALRQDLAFVVDEDVAAGDVIAAAREAAGPELREIHVFDVYRGGQIPDGKKSVALAVAFQSPERTLSDEDAVRLREHIVTALAERFGAELRA
jgi:phenylalanyl-tRNA synthetase beta chain